MQDSGAIPDTSTIINNFRGGELGSTGAVKTKPRSRCASDLNRKNLTTANDNFAYEDYALAA